MLHGLIGQIRFRPTLNYLRNITQIAEKLEPEFEEWQAKNGSNHITLSSPTKKKQLQIASDAVTYINTDETAFEKSGNEIVEEATRYATDVIRQAIEGHSIEEIRRIGFRCTQVLESHFTFPDLVDLVYRKFYSAAQEIRSISCDEQRDVAFTLDGKKNNFFNHVMVGPVNGQEGTARFRATFQEAVQKEFSDNNLFFDIDVFLESSLTPENVVEKLEEAAAENMRILEKLKDYIDF